MQSKHEKMNIFSKPTTSPKISIMLKHYITFLNYTQYLNIASFCSE